MSPTTCTVDKLCNNMDAVDHKHAAAASKPKNPKRWRQRPKGCLLEKMVAAMLRALTPRRESETAENQPGNAAYQYLHKRCEQLDYAGARRQALPIGSAEIESGHRHVIQQRPKLAGWWWKETDAQTMLNLRVAHVNNLGNSCRSKA